ncbi:hypothetical protein D9757_009415 [Collybiopsis confluens]|uniref:UV-endonuclease UvdE n=1 Tax=Collybiopsis confluens TaxID=2823264 RepID=A0A8H5HD58_9AGAR|nr:hypothetical protein D9757_009415 [Collybiopsis confluens]
MRFSGLYRHCHPLLFFSEYSIQMAMVQRRASARIRTMATAAPAATSSSPEPERDAETSTRKRKRVARTVKIIPSQLEAVDDDRDKLSSLSPSPSPPPKKPRKQRKTKVQKPKTKSKVEAVDDGDGDGKPETISPKKPRKPRASRPKPEPVYVIPDVERRETKFRGRLGYACLNTILRSKRPASEAVFCSRTCRIDSIKKNGMEWVKDLGKRNVQDLMILIQWNEDNVCVQTALKRRGVLTSVPSFAQKIRFLRISSEMFPFASHPIYGYSLDYCSDLLAQAGALANKYGHRITTHPGQFTQLGSPKPNVVENSIRELKYHCEMLDLMGIGKDGVMIIHGGGVYDDKPAALERIKTTIRGVLPQNVRERLVLENDELCYNAEDLLPICESLSVPLVFDYHHDALYPSTIPPSTIIQRANAIFARRGIRPKQHLSEPRPGAETLMERRAHADRCEKLPAELEMEGVAMDVDLMIEAKDKEQAVLQLYRVYGLEEVKHESLRPPNLNQSKETKGRKSNKKGKKGKGGEEEEGDAEEEGERGVGVDGVDEAQVVD